MHRGGMVTHSPTNPMGGGSNFAKFYDSRVRSNEMLGRPLHLLTDQMHYSVPFKGFSFG